MFIAFDTFLYNFYMSTYIFIYNSVYTTNIITLVFFRWKYQGQYHKRWRKEVWAFVAGLVKWNSKHLHDKTGTYFGVLSCWSETIWPDQHEGTRCDVRGYPKHVTCLAYEDFSGKETRTPQGSPCWSRSGCTCGHIPSQITQKIDSPCIFLPIRFVCHCNRVNIDDGDCNEKLLFHHQLGTWYSLFWQTMGKLMHCIICAKRNIFMLLLDQYCQSGRGINLLPI